VCHVGFNLNYCGQRRSRLRLYILQSEYNRVKIYSESKHVLILSLSVAAAWIYLAVLHGQFWRTDDKKLDAVGVSTAARVAIIVPARDEVDVIGRAVISLLNQEYAGEFHVFLVDDHSTDGTAEVAWAAASDRSRLTIISGQALPIGWSGKVWAMQQGWQAAQQFAPERVWLTDADVEHPPDALQKLASKMDEGFDLVSLMVRLHCDTFAERLMIPAFVYFFFMLYPPRWVANLGRKTAGAAGGCVLVRAAALRKANAFESIAGEIIDDCSLAARVKSTGGRVWLGLADESRSVRGYGGMSGIVKMISRTAFNQLRHSVALLLLCVVGMGWLFYAPIVSLFSSGWIAGLVACVLMVITYLPMARWYRLSPIWAFTLPLAAFMYLYATVVSAVRYWSGSGGQWKGRSQDVLAADERRSAADF
jgi:hopene-associated glycosyltransferase HpnB